MRTLPLRVCALSFGLLWLMLAVIHAQATSTEVRAPLGGTIPPNAPALQNWDFECSTGYYTQTDTAGKIIHIPDDWKFVAINGTPRINSARINFTGSCTGEGHVEKMSGGDSLFVEAQDLEKTSAPGKPFDVAFYQQISATIGGAYSLSGWLLTLCGGSSVPSDCPNGYYMDKLLGIDPTGGIDPTSDTVIWASNRHNFIEEGKKVGWANLRISAIAQAMTITVFARINSPFQWHGNHGFIDALSLVRAPTAMLTVPVTVTNPPITVTWSGQQSPDVEVIPGGTYKLYFDVQYRPISTTNWLDLVSGAEKAGSAALNTGCSNVGYEFRVRARAEQPPAPPEGASPNQRYPGLWSDPQSVLFATPPIAIEPSVPLSPTGDVRLFLPMVQNMIHC